MDHADPSEGRDPLAWIVGEVELDRLRSSIQERLFGRTGGLRPAMLGRFHVRKKLGRGGMGTVYEAFDPCLHRMVALKVVRAEQRGIAAVRRMLREARALARLNHPNVVEVYDAGTCGDEFFIAMELIDGPTLRHWLGESRRTQAEVLDMFMAVGRGLAAAHEAQVVHRDFKPDNVLIGSDGRPRVVDFGVAGQAPMHALPTLDGSTSSGAEGLVAGAAGVSERDANTLNELEDLALESSEGFLGTPAYMAPEQLENLRADARADQYAFCVALHEALLGRRPFEATTVRSLRRQLRVVRGPTITNTGIPRRLARVLARGLSTRPADRYPSMEALLGALTVTRRRKAPRVALISAAVTASAVLSGWLAVGMPLRDVCDREGNLEAVWNPARAARITLALTRDQNPHAIDVAEHTVAAVESWRAAWLDAYAKTCGAAFPSVQRERALTCLEADRDATAEALGRLEHGAAGGEPVSEAPALGNPQACRETSRVSEAGADLRERIALLHRKLAVGEFEAAELEGPDLLNAARRHGERSLESEVAYALGEVHALLGPVTRAESLLREAFVAATEAPRPDLAVQAGTALVRLMNAEPERRTAAEHWRRKTATQLAALPLPEAEAIRIDFRVAELELQGSDRELAAREPELTQLATAVAELRAPLPTTLARIATLRARLALTRGQLATAHAVLEEALTHVSAALGPRHLEVASLHQQVGHVLLASGRAESAVQPFEDAAVMLRHTLGSQHPVTAQAWLELAEAELAAHRPQAARDLVELARHALAQDGFTAHAGLGGTSPLRMARVESLAGRVMQLEGDDAAAIEPLRKALALRKTSAAVDGSALARDRLRLAQALVRQRGTQAGEPAVLEEALGLAELGHDALSSADRLSDRAHADAVLGEVLLAMNDAVRAVPLLRAALEREAPDIDALVVAERRFLLARALGCTEAPEEARELADAALQTFRSKGRMVRAVVVSSWRQGC